MAKDLNDIPTIDGLKTTETYVDELKNKALEDSMKKASISINDIISDVANCSNYPDCPCGLAEREREKQKDKIRSEPKHIMSDESKSIVSNVIGQFDPEKTKLLGGSDD